MILRTPLRVTKSEADKIVEEKSAWIEKHRAERLREAQSESLPRFTEAEIRALAEKALAYIPKRVEYFAKKMNVSYGKITIRNQTTRWGSCSSLGNLNFNCLLMLLPADVMDYVVVHELCHRKEMNHSPRFWAEVERVVPEYRKHVEWLKQNGGAIIGRMR